MRHRILGLLVAMHTATGAWAQAPVCATVVRPGVVRCQAPIWRGSEEQPKPRYPLLLRQAGVRGRVHFTVVADTSGRPLLGTLQVLSSDHELFTTSIKNSLGLWRLEPAMVEGRLAEALYEVAYDFLDFGLVRLTAGVPLPPFKEVEVQTRTGDRTHWDLVFAAMETVVNSPRSLNRYSICLAIDSTLWDPEMRARLAATGRRMYPSRDCPRTYASMFASNRAEDRAPPDYVDPMAISASDSSFWGEDVGRVNVNVSQGTERLLYECTARMVDGRAVEVSCELRRMSIS